MTRYTLDEIAVMPKCEVTRFTDQPISNPEVYSMVHAEVYMEQRRVDKEYRDVQTVSYQVPWGASRFDAKILTGIITLPTGEILGIFSRSDNDTLNQMKVELESTQSRCNEVVNEKYKLQQDIKKTQEEKEVLMKKKEELSSLLEEAEKSRRILLDTASRGEKACIDLRDQLAKITDFYGKKAIADILK